MIARVNGVQLKLFSSHFMQRKKPQAAGSRCSGSHKQQAAGQQPSCRCRSSRKLLHRPRPEENCPDSNQQQLHDSIQQLLQAAVNWCRGPPLSLYVLVKISCLLRKLLHPPLSSGILSTAAAAYSR